MARRLIHEIDRDAPANTGRDRRGPTITTTSRGLDREDEGDDADVTRDGVEHATTVLSHRLARMLTEVELALISHDDGSYGVCKACHKTIAFERRPNLWPQATLCITCKGRTESYVDDTCGSNSSASG